MRVLASLMTAIALLLTNAAGARAQEDAAPFGLVWLASSDEIAELGISLTPMDSGTFGKSFAASNLPKALSDIETVVLSFGYDDRLWRVVALSNDFDSDKYGSQGKARYAQIEASLKKSYELEDTYHQASSDSFYGKPDNFAYSLSKNEAFWYSTYSAPSADIELSLNSDHEDTYWRLIYSHRAGKKAFDAGKSDAELDAL
jgi:hypothetical protein